MDKTHYILNNPLHKKGNLHTYTRVLERALNTAKDGTSYNAELICEKLAMHEYFYATHVEQGSI